MPRKSKSRTSSRSKVIGTKAEVWSGVAQKTVGGLRKRSLTKNKRGKVVSLKQSARGKQLYKSNGLRSFKYGSTERLMYDLQTDA